MAKTSAQLQKQIEALQKEAEAIRRKEVPGVVARIKVAIQQYGLTAADLGFTAISSKSIKSPFTKSSKGDEAAAKYSDGAGNVWGGRGPRPAWLRAALAEGKSLSDFATSPAASGGASGRGRKAKAATKANKTSAAKYSDGAGKTWSGRGPRPGWVKEALAQGKQLSDLLAT